MWANSTELLETIHDAHTRLKTGVTDAISAHAEARILGAATRILAITLEHARLTGRLEQGSTLLPLMTIDANAQERAAIEVQPSASQLGAAAS